MNRQRAPPCQLAAGNDKKRKDFEFMNYAEKQKTEVATVSPRPIKINLSDEDVKRLYEKAAGASITPEQLIENFIADLVCGTHTNGSDERQRAEEWFERCWFSLDYYGSFLAYLVKNSEYSYFAEQQKIISECKDELSELDISEFDSGEEYDEEKEYITRRLEQANEEIKEMFDEYVKHGENPETFEEEIENIRKYEENLKNALAHKNERTV